MESKEFSDISLIVDASSNPILSSTRIGADVGVTQTRSRRRIRVDSSDDEDRADKSLFLAPFPNSLMGQIELQPRSTSSQLNSSVHNRRVESSSSADEDEAPRKDGGYGDYSASESGDDNDIHSTAERSDDEDDTAMRSDEAEEFPAPRTAVDGDVDVDVEALNRLQRLAKGASKRTVKHPRAKVDSTRVLGEYGLPALLKRLEKTKFKGRGHEFEDLDRLLFLYESWANRMIPQFSFGEVVDRLEVIGLKREIHNAMQRMRAGTWPMAALSAEFVTEQDDEDLSNDVPLPTPNPMDDDPLNYLDDDLREMVRLPGNPKLALPQEPTPTPLTSPYLPPPPLATSSMDFVGGGGGENREMERESVQERIEQNRRLAIERLEARRLSALSSSRTIGALTSPARPSVLKSVFAATRSVGALSLPLSPSVTESSLPTSNVTDEE